MRSNKGLLETIYIALSSFCRLNSRCSQNTLEHRSRISALGYESEKLRTVNKRAAAMRTAKVLEAFMGPGACPNGMRMKSKPTPLLVTMDSNYSI